MNRFSLALLVCTVTVPLTWASAPLVSVDFYGESLCPYCANFTLTTVAALFDSGLSKITSFQYIAWGNARNKTDKGVVCQHGPEECDLNRVINCAIHLHPYQDVWFPFVRCLEGKVLQGQAESATKDCSEEVYDSGYHAIADCASGSMADELDVKAAADTNKLKPPHKYVPWVVVNGIPLGGAFQYLPTIICAAYTGERPKECYADPPDNDILKGANPLGRVSWQHVAAAAAAESDVVSVLTLASQS